MTVIYRILNGLIAQRRLRGVLLAEVEKQVNEKGRKRMIRRKWFLYVTEFFSGMSVMAVELGASRLLAPYFSSSQIVWTIIIGTIMIAIAIGNVWGGRTADKNSNPDRLYIRILVAAVWTAAVPLAGKYVIVGVSALLAFFVGTNFLIWATSLSCLILFVFPLLLLGTVTPSLTKFAVNNLDNTGKTVGTLGALNTVGSIIGTFLPTFVTIPAWGTAMTFLIFAGILLLIGGGYFLIIHRRLWRCLITALLVAGLGLSNRTFRFALSEDGVAYEGESVYNYLQVKEDEKSVVLSTNVLFGVQSVLVKDGSLTGMYYDYALAAPLMADVEDKEKCPLLILGLGSGTYATQCMRYFDNVDVTGVEIDKKIVSLAETYFCLPEDTDVSVFDGRAFLSVREPDKKYDVIMVDAYQDITIPFQMSTVEFFTLVKEHLNEGGVMVVNMNMRSDREDSISQYLCDTIASVFETAYTVRVQDSTNLELFASDNPEMLDVYAENIRQLDNKELSEMMRTVSDGLTPVDGGSRILTDDKAPVELLGMRALDEMIEDELNHYRNTVKEEGVSGLLNELK